MATILGLALKVTGEASGLAKSLDPVDKALANIGKQVDNATKVFAPFTAASAAAANAQQGFADKFAALADQLKAKSLGAIEYAAAFASLTEEAKGTAAAFAEGLRVTEANKTAEEQRAAQLERISELLKLGAISEETAARATAEASGANAEAARAEKARADAMAEAARIVQANLTPQERYDTQIQELRGHLEAGRLTQDQYNRAAAKARADLAGVGDQAGKTDKNIQSLNRSVGILATIEVGRVIVDGLQVLGNTFAGVTSQITTLVSSVNSSLDTLNDFSARTGIGVEALQGYSLAAKLAGVDTEQFGAAVQRLAINIGKTPPGGELDKALQEINLSVGELRALAPEQQFAAIGDAIAGLPTAAERAAAAVQIFGKQGAALAPLFREGAASIEELRARADRLGIIVDQVQIDNVASMNDAFDLVRATVEGITGQVIGNLAPAVTTVTEEFLKFVEEWSGSQGQGGTGIANAITDTLLSGAEILAGVFDSFVGNFDGFAGTLEAAGTAFSVVSNSLKAISEGLRVVFNTFEIVGNNLIIGLGSVLEGLGKWISEDLAQVGRDLQASGKASLEQNKAELEAAKQNAIDAANAAFGGAPAAAREAGGGAASQFLDGLRERIARERAPEFKIATDIEATRDRFDAFFNGIADQESAVTDAMRGFEAAAAAAVDPLKMTAEEIAAIEEAQRTVNALIDAEIASRTDAREAATKQADEDAKRIDGFLKTSDAAAKIEEDILAVQREQERVAVQIAAARAAGDAETATAAAGRLGQLDQLQAKLAEQQQAAEQGFGEGFAQAFASIDENFTNITAKAQEFGQAGFDAAARLQDGIQKAQEQARAGILNKEAFDAEVQRQQAAFQQELENIQRAGEERKRVAETVDQLIFGNLSQGEQARIEAAKNLLLVEQEIAATQQRLEEARKAGDQEAIKAAEIRLKQLDQAAGKERDIANGAAEQRALLAKQQEQYAAAQQQQYQQAMQAQQAAAQEQARIAEETRKAQEEEFNRQQERIAKLNTLGSTAVKTSDVRTAEGAAMVLDLAASAQDPALIEQRIQTKLLNQIAIGLAGAAANYFNQPVAIVGAARLGGFN